MPDDHEKTGSDWRIPDAWWARLERRLPPRKPHPLGCHRPRVDDRQAMDAIFFVLRTGCQWGARHSHRPRLHVRPIVAFKSGRRPTFSWPGGNSGLVEYDAVQGIDWEWLAMDGAMTKAPLGGKKVGKTPTARGKSGTKRSVLTDGGGAPSASQSRGPIAMTSS